MNVWHTVAFKKLKVFQGRLCQNDSKESFFGQEQLSRALWKIKTRVIVLSTTQALSLFQMRKKDFRSFRELSGSRRHPRKLFVDCFSSFCIKKNRICHTENLEVIVILCNPNKSKHLDTVLLDSCQERDPSTTEAEVL